MRRALACAGGAIGLATCVAFAATAAPVAPPAGVVPLTLSGNPPDSALFSAAGYLDDPHGTYDIDDVSRGAQRDAFATFPEARRGDRFVSGWFRFALRAPAENAAAWAILADTACDVADLYYPRPDGTYGVIHFGMLVPLARRDGDITAPFVRLTPDLADGKRLYLFIRTNETLIQDSSFFYAVATEPALANARQQLSGDTFFGGLFFALLVSNVFLAFYLRDRTFLAYVFAMALHVLTQFTQDGTAWKFFWPYASVPYGLTSVVVETLFLAVLAIFWRTFLDLPRRFPALDRVLLALVGLQTLRGILVLALPRPGWLTYMDFPLVYAAIATALFAAVHVARRGYRPARFFIVALGGLLVFWGLAYFNDFLDTYPPGLLGNLIQWGLYYGVAWDALFLTFALADRIETANKNMIAAQRESEDAKDAVLVAQAETVERLRERDVAVSRFLPREFLEHLGRETVVDLQLGDHVEREMTILFSDIRAFTALSETMSPEQTFRLLNRYLARIGPVIRAHGGFIDKYVGDAVMGLFPDNAETALEAAIAMQRSVGQHNHDRARAGYAPLVIGVGLHRGPLMLGAIGETERIETTVIADAVNIAARTESLTKPFGAGIIVSESVVNALAKPDDYRLRHLGSVMVKGSSRGLNVFEVFDSDPPELLLQKIATLDTFRAGIDFVAAGRFAEARRCFIRVLDASPHDAAAAYLAEQCRMLDAGHLAAAWTGSMRVEAT